jgi:glutathione S-transferase
MRTLYHFKGSPFSRRVRLALAHKGLDCELREVRDNPAFLEEARRLVPFRTIPVLVDDGRAMGDSTAIAHWLDHAYPRAPALFPAGDGAADAFQVAALVDVVLNGVIDPGTRYWPLRGDAAWQGVKTEMLGRARLAAEGLAARAEVAGRATLGKSGWSAADMWLLTAVLWFESMPARAATSKNIEQILTLGFELPAGLSRWADAHRGRDDVRALG